MPQVRMLLALAVTPLILVACGDDSANTFPDARPAPDAALPDGDAPAPDAGGQDLATCEPATLDGRTATGTWDSSFTIAGLTGYDGFTPAVHGFGTDVDGSAIAVGYFLWAGTERVGPAARFRNGGWEPMRDDLSNPDFSAVAVAADGRVALATFHPLAPVVRPEPQRGEILVDIGAGLTSIGTFTGVVRALAWFDDQLWVAGHFELEAGVAGLAVWDGNAWAAPPGGAVNGPVYTLLAHGGSLFVGGSFSQLGGIDTVGVAEWTGTAWTPHSMSGLEPSTPYGPFKGPIVFGLARTLDGTLYASGIFYPAGQPTSGGVAQWTGAAWEILGNGFAKSGGLSGDEPATVSDVVIHQGDIYAAGCFTRSGGDPDTATSLPGVARWDGTSWSALPGGVPGFVASGWFQAFVCGGEPSGTAILEAQFQALHSNGEHLFVGGAFAGIDGVASQSMIAHDGQRWVPLGAPANKGVAGSVSELASGGSGCDVYALGGSHAGGEPTGGKVVRFDGQSWTPVMATRPEGAYCTQLAASFDGEVYLGCDVAGQASIYRLDDGAWTLLPEIPVVGGLSFGELKVDLAGRVWVAGGSGTAGWLARLDGEAFIVIADSFDGNVTRIAFAPGDSASDEVVVGGSFAKVGTLAAGGIARFDGTTWHALGDGLTTTPSQNPVGALAWTENAIYASTYWGGPGSDHVVLGRFDGTAWEELGVPERGLPPHVNPEGEHQIFQLFARGDVVVAAGSIFPEEGGRHVFVFDGERFTPLAGGVGAINVDAFAATPDALWFGGSIATTGIADTLAPSVGVARFELASP